MDYQKIDQKPLAMDVSDKIKYEFFDSFLVKPLTPVKVKKEFSTPIATDKPKADKNGIEATDYDKVKKEVNSFKTSSTLLIFFSV